MFFANISLIKTIKYEGNKANQDVVLNKCGREGNCSEHYPLNNAVDFAERKGMVDIEPCW